MPGFLAVYLILVAVSLFFNICGYANEKKPFQTIGLIICIVGGVVLAIGMYTLDSSVSTGAYIYKVNGATVASGMVSFFQAFAFLLLGTAFPNLVGLGIGEAILKSNRSSKENRKMTLFGKIVCVYLLIQSVAVILLAFASESSDGNTVAYVLAGMIFLVPGLLLLRKWIKSKHK